MLKILAGLFLSLLCLSLVVATSQMVYRQQASPYLNAYAQARINQLERQIAVQNEWIRQREQAARFSDYEPRSLQEIEAGRDLEPHSIIGHVSQSPNGTPYANWHP